MTEQEQLSILRARLPKRNEAKEFLHSDEASDLLDEEDKKLLEQHKAEGTVDSNATEEVKKAFKDLAAKVTNSRARSRAAASSSAAGGAPPKKKKRRYPAVVDVGPGITVAQLNEFVPEGCRFGIDRLDQGWRMTAWGHRLFRAWGQYGADGAAKLLIGLGRHIGMEEGFVQECPFPELLPA